MRRDLVEAFDTIRVEVTDSLGVAPRIVAPEPTAFDEGNGVRGVRLSAVWFCPSNHGLEVAELHGDRIRVRAWSHTGPVRHSELTLAGSPGPYLLGYLCTVAATFGLLRVLHGPPGGLAERMRADVDAWKAGRS